MQQAFSSQLWAKRPDRDPTYVSIPVMISRQSSTSALTLYHIFANNFVMKALERIGASVICYWQCRQGNNCPKGCTCSWTVAENVEAIAASLSPGALHLDGHYSFWLIPLACSPSTNLTHESIKKDSSIPNSQRESGFNAVLEGIRQ